MDDNTNTEIDPWAQMGNTVNNNTGEVTQEGLEREAAWNEAMADAPEFQDPFSSPESTPAETSPQLTTETATPSQIETPPQSEAQPENQPRRDENIADASAIINYGLNAAAKQLGVEHTIQIINNFVPNSQEDPISQLLKELGIDTKKEHDDLKDQSKAIKTDEDSFRQDINAPSTTQKSTEGALKAIQDVKELVSDVQSSPAYAKLRTEATSAGKGVFDYAVEKYPNRDFTVLFKELNNEKSKANTPQQTPELQESPKNPEATETTQDPENPTDIENPETSTTQQNPETSTISQNPEPATLNPQITNQSSTKKSSPETAAAASIGL